jgi:hypothetical protein
MFNFTPALNKTSLFSMGHCNYIKKNKESPPRADGVLTAAFEKSVAKLWPAALKETPQGAGN